MEFKKIDTGNIQLDMAQYAQMLKDHRKIKDDLYLRFNELVQMYEESHEERIRRMALPSQTFDREKVQGGDAQKDLADFLQKMQADEERDRQEERKRQKEILENILLEDASLDRIWDAYRATSPDNHILLHELYIRQEKWDTLAIRYGSRSTLSFRRHGAVLEALSLYNNEVLGNEELHRLANCRSSLTSQPPATARKKKNQGIPGQIGLEYYEKAEL